MRGWTFIFKGYPTESELIAMFNSGEPVSLDGAFFAYFGVFLLTFIFTTMWQTGKDIEHHEDVKTSVNAEEGEYERV